MPRSRATWTWDFPLLCTNCTASSLNSFVKLRCSFGMTPSLWRLSSKFIPSEKVCQDQIILVAYRYVTYPWMMRWRTTADEPQQKLPGDDLVAHPRSQTTMAITIHANVTAVWPWLVQMGQGRGGFYTYDWLENLLGCDIHNVDRIHSEWQAPKVGDLVRMYREGGGPPLYQIAAIEPEQALILGHPLDNNADWGDSWTFAL